LATVEVDLNLLLGLVTVLSLIIGFWSGAFIMWIIKKPKGETK